MTVYRLFWDEFSSWYLEMVKPAYGSPIDGETYKLTLGFFDNLLRLLHPFMPFITEELWQHLEERRQGESIMYAMVATGGEVDTDALARMEITKEIVNGVRGVRAKRNIPNRESLTLNVVGGRVDAVPFGAVVAKLANVKEIDSVESKDPTAAEFMVGTTQFNVPLEANIDVEAELAKLQKDLDHYVKFRDSINKKLSNERFVNNAPAAVVEAERKKLADSTARVEALTASINALKK